MRPYKIQYFRPVLITPHQGMGDHILCNGIYREYSKKYKFIFILVKNTYTSQVSRMLSDISNIRLISIPITRSWVWTKISKIIARGLGIKVIGLGSYGKNFFTEGTRFDENFYKQANLDFEKRWSSFYVERNMIKENELQSTSKCISKGYVFLHEDLTRNFQIDRKYLPPHLKVVEPSANPKSYTIFDYRKIIENATEIHVIESSFAAFIESIGVNIPLFIHRYSRPHALNDFRHEFTYRSGWKILLGKKE